MNGGDSSLSPRTASDDGGEGNEGTPDPAHTLSALGILFYNHLFPGYVLPVSEESPALLQWHLKVNVSKATLAAITLLSLAICRSNFKPVLREGIEGCDLPPDIAIWWLRPSAFQI